MLHLARFFAIARKDIKSELRTRYAITAMALFVLTTISMIVFATAGEKFNPELASGVLWIIMFFSAMTGLAKSFVSEEERATVLLLQMTSTSSAVYVGKLIFTTLLSLFLNVAAIILFLGFTGLEVKNWWIFGSMAIIGSIGLAAATTIISAIIAKAGTKNALFPVLAFPLLLPLILTGVETTIIAFVGAPWAEAQGNIILMLCYAIVVITSSILLFEFVWME
jgi:heme exporter protein B